MNRNPRLSKKMHPLRENTMRLGDAMKYGRILLDAGIPIHLWDGSGWEIAFKPDDSYSTPSGRAASGGRRYLAKEAGLIKTWPITLLSEAIRPAAFIGVPAIRHFLAHRRAGVASNGRVCPNPLCKATARRNNGETLKDLDRKFYALQDKLDALKKAGQAGSAQYMDILKEMQVVGRERLRTSGLGSHTLRNPRREPYCRMCGKDRRQDGPFRRPKVGPMKGKTICDECYRGWRSGRRGGSKWAMNRRVRRNSDTVNDNARIQHEQIVEAFLSGRKKKVGPRYWTDGTLLRVWGNLVARRDPTGVELYDAGYRTLLTKNILNTVLRHLGQGTIYQKARQWYISTTQGAKPWPGSWIVVTNSAAANHGRKPQQKSKLRCSMCGRPQPYGVEHRYKRKPICYECSYTWGHDKDKTGRTQWDPVEGRRTARNPRIRAWNIVAFIPGRPERWIMQSGIKDKKRAEETAQVYRDIAKKERRRHRYVVRPFRYSDTASRMKKNPVEGWVVTRDGETLKTGFANHLAAMGWLHRHTSTSVDHAVQHEGYDIVEVRGGKVVQSYKRDVIGSRKRYRTNPLTARESARLIRASRGFMQSAKSEFTSRKEKHYRYGQASGVAAAVQVTGHRRAEIPAAMMRARAFKAHRAAANPRGRRHAGLRGLMSNGDAKSAMRFA